jgi:hypothetical protein
VYKLASVGVTTHSKSAMEFPLVILVLFPLFPVSSTEKRRKEKKKKKKERNKFFAQ